MVYIFCGLLIGFLFFFIGRLAAQLSPIQDSTRAHIITSFGLDGGMIFHAIMVLTGPDNNMRNEQARRIESSYLECKELGVLKVAQTLRDLSRYHAENPNEITAFQAVIMKRLVSCGIIKKHFPRWSAVENY